MPQVTPNGSLTWPYLSPQKATSSGTTTSAPASVARFHHVSASSTIRCSVTFFLRLVGRAVFRERIVEHHRPAVDLDMDVHGAAVGRLPAVHELRAEGLLVEGGRRFGFADREIGDHAGNCRGLFGRPSVVSSFVRSSSGVPRAGRRTGPSPRGNPSSRALRGPRPSSGGRAPCSASCRRPDPRR